MGRGMRVVLLGCATGLLVPPGAAAAQGSTYLASRRSNGVPGNGSSGGASLSQDGRFVAMHSSSSNLVPGDTNGLMDAFVHDRVTGATSRVSVASSGAQADGESRDPQISGDGRFVVFSSEATNLVSGDTNGMEDVFVHELASAATWRVSVTWSGAQANHQSVAQRISFDGRYVAFHSSAWNLVPFDTNGAMTDVFVRDLLLGTTELVSLSAAGGQGDAWCQWPSLSDDGRYVAFLAQASNLVPGDANGAVDVFLRDRLLGTTVAVSRTSQGATGNGACSSVRISADGSRIVFASDADDLVATDTNGAGDVFVHEPASGTTVLASVSSSGSQSVNGAFGGVPSSDGARVVFTAGDTDLVPGDANNAVDVFLRDFATGTTELVSRSTGGAQGQSFSTYPCISGDGLFVGFESVADDLVQLPLPGSRDVFVRDLIGVSPTIAAYGTAATTGGGCSASLLGSGVPSASAGSGFVLTASSAAGQLSGTIFFGRKRPQAIDFGGTSVLCVRGPLQRTGVQATGGTSGACDGALVLDWNLFAVGPAMASDPLLGGETIWAQAWFRDPLEPVDGNLSSAIWFDVSR